jgi:hypothetical protein
MCSSPLLRGPVHALDVGLELRSVDSPHAAAADLDRRKRARPNERVDLGDADVEKRGNVLERVEAGLYAGRSASFRTPVRGPRHGSTVASTCPWRGSSGLFAFICPHLRWRGEAEWTFPERAR